MAEIGQSRAHLVGSVPLRTAAEVLRTCARELGELVAALPDGEPGDRGMWVNFQALRVFYLHPALESVSRPAPVDGAEQWIPKGLEDHWQFRVAPGCMEIEFEDLRYAGSALGSYLVFRELREAGVIPEGVRFQVCLPMTYSGTGFFFRDPVSQKLVFDAYERALVREVRKLVQAIPAEDLSIQWDVCFELLDLEGVIPWTPEAGTAWDRYVRALATLSADVPAQTLLGYHFCYADLGHRHFVEPRDLATTVGMANAAIVHTPRRVDFFHMAVPRDRDDDAYFAPLSTLERQGASVFLGLIHHTDGQPGAAARIAAARRYLDDFGVATECGFGRRPPEQVADLLRLHREVTTKLL